MLDVIAVARLRHRGAAPCPGLRLIEGTQMVRRIFGIAARVALHGAPGLGTSMYPSALRGTSGDREVSIDAKALGVAAGLRSGRARHGYIPVARHRDSKAEFRAMARTVRSSTRPARVPDAPGMGTSVCPSVLRESRHYRKS